MCIAIFSPRGTDVPKDDYLKMSFENNPDGAGFAFNNDYGKVEIHKGFMTYDAFKATFDEYNNRYRFKNRGVLIHFRIQTHGGRVPECTHPFPLTDDPGTLKSLTSCNDYAIIHNGIISLTSASTYSQEHMSDTMVFIQKYLSKIATNKRWFRNPVNFELIYSLIDSKMAILNGRGDIRCTQGFSREKDGNFYSNTTYKEARPAKTYSYASNSGSSYNYYYGPMKLYRLSHPGIDYKIGYKDTWMQLCSDDKTSWFVNEWGVAYRMPTENLPKDGSQKITNEVEYYGRVSSVKATVEGEVRVFDMDNTNLKDSDFAPTDIFEVTRDLVNYGYGSKRSKEQAAHSTAVVPASQNK